jgi:tetratricopeptide (TPR) repeat protein
MLDNLVRYNEAVECYDKAIELEPNNATLRTNKRLALDHAKK